ncbi:hypothetical protein BDR04DRAFT_1123757, partial [Suillus decipiens]
EILIISQKLTCKGSGIAVTSGAHLCLIDPRPSNLQNGLAPAPAIVLAPRVLLTTATTIQSYLFVLHPSLVHLHDEEVSADIQEALTPVTGEHATTASKNPNAISQSQTNDLNGRNVNDQGTSATCTESHNAGYSNKDHGKDTSGTSTESCYPEEGRNDDGHKTSATSTNSRPHRSGGIKSYAPDRSASEESSPSDNDWAVDKAQQKKAQQTADHDIAANHGEDDKASSEADPPSPPQLMAKQKQKLKVTVEVNEHHRSEDEDDENFVKTKGRMPQVGILKVQELGKKTLEAARTLGQEYGK